MGLATLGMRLFKLPIRLGQGVISTDISGEDDVGEAGVAGFVPEGPDGDTGEDLAEDICHLDAESIGSDV